MPPIGTNTTERESGRPENHLVSDNAQKTLFDIFPFPTTTKARMGNVTTESAYSVRSKPPFSFQEDIVYGKKRERDQPPYRSPMKKMRLLPISNFLLYLQVTPHRWTYGEVLLDTVRRFLTRSSQTRVEDPQHSSIGGERNRASSRNGDGKNATPTAMGG